MGKSSAHYGDCEACGTSCSEVFFLKVKKGGAYIMDKFGHKDCLNHFSSKFK